MTTTLLLALQ